MAEVDVTVALAIAAPPDRVRRYMFDSRHDPEWMAAVKSVETLDEGLRAGARVRRVGSFLGRTLRWTTQVVAVSESELTLRIVDGPMRGTVIYRIVPSGPGSHVTLRNIGEAPGMAPRWLLRMAMRRSLIADLRRLKALAEST